MANSWFYEILGDEFGPVSSAELKRLVADNKIDRDTIVRLANGTRRAPAYRIKGLFPAEQTVAEPISTVPVAAMVQPAGSLPASKHPRRKLDALTLTLAGGLCVFAITSIVLLLLVILRPATPKPVATTNQPQPPAPSPQSTVEATAHTQPRVEEGKEPVSEIAAESSPVTSPDVLITETAKRLGVEAMYVKDIGDITLLVGVDQMRAYVPQNHNYPLITGTDIGFKIRFLTADERVEEPSAGFIPVNGRPEQVKLSSSDPSLIEVFDDGSAGVRGAGKAIVSVECAAARISIPIQVAKVPFNVGYGKSDPKTIIATLGIPQRKRAYVVRWPQSKIIDQMYYGPDAGSQEVGEHWEYDKLPGLSIRVIGTFVEDIGMRDRPPGFTPVTVRR
ncbi:DUF4339 domain-containing protein [Roseimaritima ulvae]|uniref:GYF domain-containing protein n=1 Tax=Roseimaritima ulvae TaxID=980254 RepID=A0A5B9QN79_9BACT|nr:DUF4339 domain-containing protein [Roseimaritima ulvae]QEG40414.1 hypothetical protein UC8_24260 [Roseimaritima ulvae]